MARYRVGIDLGGTMIKGGVLDSEGVIICTDSIDTEAAKGSKHVLKRISGLAEQLIKDSGKPKSEFDGIGLGSPGIVNSEAGVVTYNNNLSWDNVEAVKVLSSMTELRVRVDNDANVAALGEVRLGSGKGLATAVLVTLGTGVGSGIIIDGKIFSGNGGAGAELGHMIINAGGRSCTCGQNGCIEAYSSASALILATKKALQNDVKKQSAMWSVVGDNGLDSINAKLPWDFCDNDAIAKTIIDEYCDYLVVGLVNVANIFRPQAIMLGGGVSLQGDNLIRRIQTKFTNTILGGTRGPKVELRTAKLHNDAGFIGAAFLLD